MDTVVFPQQKVIDYFSTQAVLAKINGPVDDTALVREFKIKGYPTFVLLDASGKEIDRMIGYFEADEFIGTIENYRNGIGTLDDLLAKVSGSTDRSLYLQIGNKYKYRGGDSSALDWYDRVITTSQQNDSLSRDARMERADMHRRSQRYDLAMAEWQGIGRDFKGTDLELEADIWVPIIYKLKGDTAKAIEQFRAFLTKYPKSEDTAYVLEQIDLLGGAASPEAKQ